MVREQLTKVVNLRISPSEFQMLERLSEDTGLPMSAVVRQLVRKEHGARYGETTSAPVHAKRLKPKRK
jgi:hypothetical protein